MSLEEAQAFWQYATEDLTAARLLVDSSGIAPRLVCVLAQQAGEKALKTALIVADIEVPYHHNLDGLRDLLPLSWRGKITHPALKDLTDWAVEARYPGDSPDATLEDARLALRLAEALIATVADDVRSHGLPVAGP